MKIRLLTLSLILAVADAPCGEEMTDSRQRAFVLPEKVVWTSNRELRSDKGGVTNAEVLLEHKFGQLPEKGWGMDGRQYGCSLVNNGAVPGVILDFGREIHGGVRLACGRSSKGHRCRIRFGESVSETMSEQGEKNAGNDHAIRDEEVLLPCFGYKEVGQTGFRFVRIDLLTEGRLVLEDVRAVSLMRPMARIGDFRCSDERVNRVFETAVRTVHLCCQDYLWDGIKRDRLVWTGDMHPETMVILRVFGAATVLPETLEYVASTTRIGTWMNGMPTYSLWWIRNLAEWYRFTGDTRVIGKLAEYLKKTFTFVESSVDADGTWKEDAFLDWPTRHNHEAELAGTQGLLLLTMRDVSFLARELNDWDLARRADELSRRVGGKCVEPAGEKSAAALLALSGLRDAREMFEKVLSQKGHEGVSTFYGYYMLEAMSAANENQRALDTVREYWGAMLDMGATSFWEDFSIGWTNNSFRIDEVPVSGRKDIHGDYGEFCYKGFRHSLCHGWSAGPAAWCISHVLGIRPVGVGCKKIEVCPNLCDLKWAEGSMALPTGERVTVRVEGKSDGSMEVSVTAPAGIEVVRDVRRCLGRHPDDGQLTAVVTSAIRFH